MILLQQAAFSVAEPLVNKALNYDLSARAQLNKLEGSRFAVNLTDIKVQMSLWVLQGKLRLSSSLEQADCTITTSSKQLNTLSDAAKLTQLIKQDELMLEGDLAIAQGYSDLLVNNQIDWQELLSRYIGDAMAYRVAQGITRLQTLVSHKLVDLRYTSSTLLTEELKVAPTGTEVDEFIQGVSDTQAQVDMLQMEVAKLRSQK